MIELHLLETFLEIYRSGSVTTAGARLGLSQPAVSARLARLEEQLGGPLFVRAGRGLSPNARADELAGRAGPHLDQLRHALDGAGRPDGHRGTVHIGGAGEIMAARILPALAPLVAGGMRLRVTIGLAEDLLTALGNARLDLVVSAVRPTRSGLAATPLIDEEFLLVGAPTLARTIDATALAADPVAALSHLPLIGYADDLPIVRRYWRSEFGRRPPNPVAVVVPDLRAVLAAVIAGAGVSVLPRYLTEAALTAGSVEQLHQPEVSPLNTLYLATQRAAREDPSLALVHRHLLDRARAWGTL
jgi:DNA-binding transcriptional LysR family regulator